MVTGPALQQEGLRGCERPGHALPRRERLEEERLSDGRYQLQRVPGGRVALPVLEEKLSQLCLSPEMPCELVRIQDPVLSRAARRCTPAQKLRDELRRLLGASWSEELERDVPHAWQRHGDLVLLSEDSFKAAPWERLGKGEQGLPAPVLPAELPSLPKSPGMAYCRLGALGARWVARRGRVMPDGMWTPSVTLLLGQHSWVEHVDSKAHCAAVKPQNLQQKRQGLTGDGPFIKDGLLLHSYSRPDINLGGGSRG
ncbi:hypothetical protein HGM15179_019293 [Zosterops borbonicus]|uniref:Uncharacterized protein n=1 Tax=Zosterops borbonicus TaxID=364589 RepID=A0A8K1DA88_9PASS|nr:hypothetical protein HGM15179_019293 [Zosterops borbonicus]